jgi:hypothetical protein
MDKYCTNGFPAHIVQLELKKALMRSQPKPTPKKVFTDWVAIPFIPGIFQGVSRILGEKGIRVVSSKISCVGGIVATKSSGNRPVVEISERGGRAVETKGVIYQIPCKTCEKIYTGETGRCFLTREAEHKGDFTHKRPKSRLAPHALNLGHVPNFEGAKLLHYEKNQQIRLQLEAYESAQQGTNSFNVFNNEFSIKK